MVALANRVGAHPWFNIPHQADDDYVQNFAQVVKANLDPALGVYVEYSDETWNYIFAQATYVQQQGAAQNPPMERLSFSAWRSRTIGQIFKTALGQARVVAVLNAQAGWLDTATIPLDYLIARYPNLLGIDAVAIAPYFYVMPDPTSASIYTSMSMDNFFNQVRSTVVPAAITSMQQYRALANRYGVRLISYEGGQHMMGVAGAESDPALVKFFNDFNRDPRIKQVYLDYLAGWKAAGGELFMHYSDVSKYGRYGYWGALEYIAQPRASAPKFDALQTFIEQNNVWWTQ
jgi:hypothetical protein